jgi:hypothetical protein
MVNDDGLIAARRVAEVAVDPTGLLGEPAEELSRVGSFAHCVPPGLAVLQRDQARTVLDLSGHDLKCAAQKFCTFPR